MAVNPFPQSDQNQKESPVFQVDNNSYAEWKNTGEAANRAGLLAAGELAGRSDSNSGQRGNHPHSEQEEKEAKKKEAATQFLITTMLQLERLEQEYRILQKQISDLNARKEKALEDARLLEKEAGGLHDHLTKFAGARDADNFIEQRKAEIRAEIAEKMENLSKQGLSGDDLKREQEKLLAEEKSAMEALDNAKQTYKQFVVTLDEDQQRLTQIDQDLKQKELEIANIQKDLEQKQIKAEAYAEKIKDLEQQVAKLKNEHETVEKHARETKEKLDAYNIAPPKSPEEIALGNIMREIKSVTDANAISAASLDKILENAPEHVREKIAKMIKEEKIDVVSHTPYTPSYASLMDDEPGKKSRLGTEFSRASTQTLDQQPGATLNLANAAKPAGLNA